MRRTFTIVVNGKSYEVGVGDLRESPISVTVNGKVYQVEIKGLASAPRWFTRSPVPSAPPSLAMPDAAVLATKPPGQAVSAQDFTAPMPGVIRAIKVAPGQQVQHGDELLVLEAMKMEQSLRSTQAGEVKEVLVSVGQGVAYGEVLLRFT